MTALYNLLAGYTVGALAPRELRVVPGLLPDEAVLRIDAVIVGTGLRDQVVTREIGLQINAKSRLVVSVGKDKADITGVSFITDSAGKVIIDVRLGPDPDTAPSGAFNLTGRCEGRVSLDLFGDTRRGSRTLAQCRSTLAGCCSPSKTPLSSTDF